MTVWRAVPDRRSPVKARAVHDRCSRLAALTDLHQPRLLGHHAVMASYGRDRSR